MTSFDWLLVISLAIMLALSLVQHLRLRRERERAERAYVERAEANAVCEALEELAKQSRQHLDALGTASTDALLLLDGDRQIIWANRAAGDMFGESAAQVGQTFIALVRDYELNQAVVDAAAGRRPIVRQIAVGNRTLRILAAPIENHGGAAVIVEDVTELQRLGRARRDFVANISHELRTPLANIDLAAQTLRSSEESDDPALTQRMLDQIQAQVQTLSQLSQEMMELAQIESGQVLLRLVPAELEPVVRRSVLPLLPQAAAKNQHFSLLAPSGLRALIDEQQVGRVIGNLVHNAVKFAPEGGVISVAAEVVGDDVLVSVSDNGPGIPKEEQGRVFERFYKADRARSKGGTGLGLAIAKHIVEGHGGRIWVESIPGQGSTFCFTLPQA